MTRPVTIFTGQWADLTCEDMVKLTHKLGYDGIELACWGDHFEVDKASEDASYITRKRELLEQNDLKAFAIYSPNLRIVDSPLVPLDIGFNAESFSDRHPLRLDQTVGLATGQHETHAEEQDIFQVQEVHVSFPMMYRMMLASSASGLASRYLR